jgi:hypothetical protein
MGGSGSRLLLGQDAPFVARHARIPRALLESGFQMSAPDPSEESRRFNCYGVMCHHVLELVPLTDVEFFASRLAPNVPDRFLRANWSIGPASEETRTPEK